MMRDVMQNAGLEIFAEVGLLIFFGVFLALMVRALMMRRGDVEEVSQLPLQEPEPQHGEVR